MIQPHKPTCHAYLQKFCGIDGGPLYWNKFLDQKFKYIYKYFSLQQDRDLLKKYILSYENKEQILSSIPTGKTYRIWKEFKNSF
jgi:hypothetical protein